MRTSAAAKAIPANLPKPGNTEHKLIHFGSKCNTIHAASATYVASKMSGQIRQIRRMIWANWEGRLLRQSDGFVPWRTSRPSSKSPRKKLGDLEVAPPS